MIVRLRRLSIPIFPKMVILFLSTMIPLYTISLLMNQAGSDSVKSEISRSQLAQVQYFLRSLEIEINRIVHLERTYINDGSLQQLSVEAEIMSDYEKTQAVTLLQQRLQIIKNSSPYIENVSAHIPLVGHTVSTNSFYSPIPSEEFDNVKGGATKESPFIYWQGRLFVSLTYPDTFVNSNRIPNYVLSVELSVPHLTNALNLFANPIQGGAVLKGPHWELIGRDSVPPEFNRLETERMSEDSQPNIGRLRWNNSSYLVAFGKSEVLGASLFLYMPEDAVLGPLKTYRFWFWILSLFSIVIVSLFSFWIYRQIHQPLRKLVRAFRRTELGDLETAIPVWGQDEFNYIYDQFNTMVKKLKRSLHEVVEQSTRAKQSELKQLQAQINPHFLYNSFFILHGLAKLDDRETLIHLSKRLGQYFQFLTRNGSDDVDLKVEVEHARAYVDIQIVRFSHRIQVTFQELPKPMGALRVPRLILQPIIENAYKHGLEDRQSGGFLSISFLTEGSRYIITVRDNGQGLSDEKLNELKESLQYREKVKEFTGLINVHRRLQLQFGAGSGLEIERGEEGGLKVHLIIIHDAGGEIDV